METVQDKRMKAQSLMWGNVKFWVLCIIYNKKMHSKKAFSLREVLTGLLFCTDLAKRVRKMWDGSADLGIVEELLWCLWVHNFLGTPSHTKEEPVDGTDLGPVLMTEGNWGIFCLQVLKNKGPGSLRLVDTSNCYLSSLSRPMTCGEVTNWLLEIPTWAGILQMLIVKQEDKPPSLRGDKGGHGIASKLSMGSL